MSALILATYRLAVGGAVNVADAAASFATGQSVGTWMPLPGLTTELVARHGARLKDVSEPRTIDGVECVDATIAFPSDNFEPGFPMLWTTLLGNDPSTGITAQLVDLELPGELLAAFGGPRVGIDGWRARLGSGERPLLLNPMKPSIGLTPAETATIAAAVARGGMDMVKDDEVLADTSLSTVGQRARAISRALDDVAAQTGHRARYVVSITGRAASMASNAEVAVEAGADGVMVAALGVGLDALQTLAEQLDGRLPIIAHTAGIDVWSGREGLGLAPELLVRLCRLAGSDAVLIGSPWAKRATPIETWQAMADRLRDPWSGVNGAFPVVGGGVVAGQLADIVGHLGRDLIITAGGSVNGHPGGAESGAREMREALDATLSAPA